MGGSPEPDLGQAGALQQPQNAHKDEGGWGRGWGDIGRARDLRALCTPPHHGVSLATTLVQSAKPAGAIRRREGGQGLPRETLSNRKTRMRGRSYLHNIQTNTSTRGRKKYKQEEEEEEEGGRVL